MMEKVIKEIEKLKKHHEDELEERICEFTENEDEENHVDVLLFKKRIVLLRCFISNLNILMEKIKL